jgi:hypothetical protein
MKGNDIARIMNKKKEAWKVTDNMCNAVFMLFFWCWVFFMIAPRASVLAVPAVIIHKEYQPFRILQDIFIMWMIFFSWR